MKIVKSKLEIVKNALQYAVFNSKTKTGEDEFASLLLEVQRAIFEEIEQEKYIETLKSLEGCPFVYCDRNPKCEGKCRHDKH